jgi:hypothetical protein
MSAEPINEPLKDGEQTLRDLLRGVFAIARTRLGAYTFLNSLFKAKGLNGRLLVLP